MNSDDQSSRYVRNHATRPVRYLHPVMAWRHDPKTYPQQLTHAVHDGEYVAACGVVVTALGEPWPQPHTTAIACQCGPCAQGVDTAWRRPR